MDSNVFGEKIIKGQKSIKNNLDGILMILQYIFFFLKFIFLIICFIIFSYESSESPPTNIFEKFMLLKESFVFEISSLYLKRVLLIG